MQELYGKEKIKNPSFVRVTDTIGGGQTYNIVCVLARALVIEL